MSLIGQTIDKYRIEKQLGEGGMGAVYDAYHPTLQRRVALKAIHPHLAKQPQFQQRFLNEAQTIAKLNHPSIVKVYDAGFSDGMLYIAMEFIEGGTLSQHIRSFAERKRAFKLREGLFILAQAADALDYAHRRPEKIIHRDIKPDNIMLRKLDRPDEPGEPPLRTIITDFGLAKAALGPEGNTATGSFLGTPSYMSPEQCRGQQLDGRSDIYSLGIVLYQIATGRLPFDIRTPADAVTKHLFETPPAADSVRPGLPKSVVQMIERSLAKEAASRFDSAAEMANGLRLAARALPNDETQSVYFTAARPSESLVTQVESLAKSMSVASGFSQVGPAARSQIVVTQAGKPPQTFALTSGSMTIGRTPDNDIQLDAEKISRRHARIDSSAAGLTVTDLGSTNGTFLDTSRLLEGVAQTWETGQTLRVGNCFLRWTAGQQASVPQASMQHTPTPDGRQPFASAFAPSQFDSMATPPGASRLESSGGRIGVMLSPTDLRIEPGQRATLQVQIFNRGTTVDHFGLNVTHIDQSWYTMPQESVELMPGGQGTLTVLMHPPKLSSTTAGDHQFRVSVRAQSNPDKAAAKANLHVLPFVGFSAELHPSIINNNRTSRLIIENSSNQTSTFMLAATDPAAALVFENLPDQLQVEAGAEKSAEVTIRARNRHLLGAKKTLPFSITTAANGAGPNVLPQTQSGQLTVAPRIPSWMMTVASLFFTLLCLGSVFAFNEFNKRQQQEEQQALSALQQANADATATAVEAQRAADERKAELEAQQAEAAVAATATAEQAFLDGDDDGDGLSNAREAELNTQPNNADSDGDGLNDGQEVNQYGTRPDLADTDGDGLNDGKEIELGVLPLVQDTDGDGLADGVDADPINPPTPTPDLAATAEFEALAEEATRQAIEDAATDTPTPPPPGVWEGDWVSECDVLLCKTITFRQNGDSIEGSFASGNGKMAGVIEGNRASGDWALGGAEGTFDFWISDDLKTWNGNWNKTFGWCGARDAGETPASCGVASWYGDWKSDCSGAGCDAIEIVQTGNEIFGTYANGDGTISGKANGTQLIGQWNRNGVSGSLAYYIFPDGEQFNGNFDSSFAWCGTRGNVDLPNLCLNEGLVLFDFPVYELEIESEFVQPELLVEDEETAIQTAVDSDIQPIIISPIGEP